MRACQPKDLKGREWRSTWERGRKRVGERESARMWERKRALWLLLLYVFFHLGLPYANWA